MSRTKALTIGTSARLLTDDEAILHREMLDADDRAEAAFRRVDQAAGRSRSRIEEFAGREVHGLAFGEEFAADERLRGLDGCTPSKVTT